jgi:uncharacterized SAM-binding protein YcdF (DUF218 family)
MGRFILGFVSGLVAAVPLTVAGLVGIGHLLAVEDPLAKADAIVAISGDTGPRTVAAVDLWKQGHAKVLVFSGGSLDPRSAASAELMKRQAVQLGVPAEAILVEPEAATTEENARNVARLMHEAGLRSAILVTSPYHQRRASLHFSREMSRYGLTFINRPAVDPRWDKSRWWLDEGSRQLTLVELAKLAVELVDSGRPRPSG